MKPKTKGGAILNNRRKSALQRLEKQLKSGVKPIKMEKGVFSNSSSTIYVELTEKDITRIEQEILTLKTKTK